MKKFYFIFFIFTSITAFSQIDSGLIVYSTFDGNIENSIKNNRVNTFVGIPSYMFDGKGGA